MKQLNIPTCSVSWDTNSDLENLLISIHGKHSGMLNVGSEKGDFTQARGRLSRGRVRGEGGGGIEEEEEKRKRRRRR
eukprot:3231600-Pyramimonas_sp.AAC.1